MTGWQPWLMLRPSLFRYNPGEVQPRKWENAMTLDRRAWGHRRDLGAGDVVTHRELIRTLLGRERE